MYQGNNPIAIRSMEWIAESLIQLLNEKTFESITIKDIYTRADLSRQTFYNLFDSKEDALRFYLRTLYLPFLQWLQEKENVELEDATGNLILILEKNKHIISILMENQLEIMLIECTNYAVDALADCLFHVGEKTKITPYKIALVSGAIVNAVMFWVREGMSISAKELNAVIQEFFCRVYSSTS